MIPNLTPIQARIVMQLQMHGQLNTAELAGRVGVCNAAVAVGLSALRDRTTEPGPIVECTQNPGDRYATWRLSSVVNNGSQGLCLAAMRQQYEARIAELTQRLQDDSRAKYVLWSPESTLPPKVTYATLREGQQVASLMANRNPGQSFILCRLIEKHKFIKPVPVPSGLTVEKL